MTDWIDPMMDNANMGPGKSELQDRLRDPTERMRDARVEAADALDKLEAKVEIDKITMDNFLQQLDQKDAHIKHLAKGMGNWKRTAQAKDAEIERLRGSDKQVRKDFFEFMDNCKCDQMKPIIEAAREYQKYCEGGYRYQAIDIKRAALWEALDQYDKSND